MDIDKWFDTIKKLKQEDIPMDFNGVVMTPSEYLNVVKNEEENLVSLATRKPIPVFELEDLLMQRIEMRYLKGNVEEAWILGDGKKYHWTPDEIMAEVRAKTPMGEKFLLMEKGLMDELKRKLLNE